MTYLFGPFSAPKSSDPYSRFFLANPVWKKSYSLSLKYIAIAIFIRREKDSCQPARDSRFWDASSPSSFWKRAEGVQPWKLCGDGDGSAAATGELILRPPEGQHSVVSFWRNIIFFRSIFWAFPSVGSKSAGPQGSLALWF